jgi:riboflavin synthase
MFTGLIQQIGKLAAKEMNGDSLRIGIIINTQKWNPPLTEREKGESISVNGVCLTAAEITDKGFACDVLKETINCSNLGAKQIGAVLNLERAIRAGEPLGGHLITGHVEGLGTLIRRMNIGGDWRLVFSCDKALLRQMVSKGSIACDGVSLTIASLEKTSFSVNIIPFTLQNTNLHQLREGETVNLETDLIGKYVFRWLEQNRGSKPITADLLRNAGFME